MLGLPCFSSIQSSFYRLRHIAPLLCGVGLLFYFLFPYTIPKLGLSPHLLFFIPAFLLLLPKALQKPSRIELALVSILVLAVAGSLVLAPTAPNSVIMRGWFFSLLAFWVCRLSFSRIPHRHIENAAQLLLFLYAVASLAQAYLPPTLFGDVAYVSTWFGQGVGTHYAVGLTSFTNQTAALMLPLLVYTLAANVKNVTLWRSVLWVLGCSAIYLTLSRAGWLAFIVCVFAYRFLLNNNKMLRSRISLHIVTGLCVALLTWAIPAHTISHYAPGGSRAYRWAVDETLRPTDYSLTTRLVTMQVTLHSILQEPLTGIGIGAFPSAYRIYIEETYPELKTMVDRQQLDARSEMTPHNAYAQFAAEMGLPAFFALMTYFLYLLVRIVRRSTQEALTLTAILLGLAVYLLFHDGFIDRQLWLMLGCGAAVSNKARESEA